MSTAVAGVTTLPNTSTVDDVLEIIDRDGGVIIEDIVAEATVQGLLDDLEPHFARVSAGLDPFFSGTQTQRVGGLFGRTRHVTDVALAELYVESARRLLATPVDVWMGEERITISPGIQIGVTQAIRILPGQGAQPLHRDDMSFMWRHPDYAREARLQLMLAMSDFTTENGGTLVIPGSHRWDDDRKPLREEAVATNMRRGSALLWVGSVYHAGGQNVSSSARTGLTLGFDLSFLRQEENQFLSVPIDTVRELPEEVQRMLGWDAGKNYMGWVEVDGQMIDPNTFLGTANTTAPAAVDGLSVAAVQ